ncbi:MAG: nucleotide exchange factor GrpE [Candidatus Marinimicrobia bacterium]|nr:nucleotide exchange factor GrpE [Candidatus Neomarinimicrobiota bacterium]MDD5582922.1 nucleotide exchange factor GrpE [Candidatus Neomarinimicrobiota bacterium]
MKKDENEKSEKQDQIAHEENSEIIFMENNNSKEKECQKDSEEEIKQQEEAQKKISKQRREKDKAEKEEKEASLWNEEEKEEEELDPLQVVMDQLIHVEDEKKELEERFIRLVAEFDNYKKRISRDFERQADMIREKILASLLPIMDDLDRLLYHEKENGNGTVPLEGIKLIRNNFERLLNSYGVKAFNSVGQPFDPEKHDAMMTRKSDKYKTPTVLEEFEKGYTLGDKILRHARVVVSETE